MVQVFSLLAVGTSQIGTLLGFSQFFLEQLNFLTSRSTSKQMKEVTHLQLVYPVNLELVYVILGFHILQKFFSTQALYYDRHCLPKIATTISLLPNSAYQILPIPNSVS